MLMEDGYPVAAISQANNMAINFIAEVSINHSKDLDRSLDFIDSAAEIGCDSVKFQLFKINQLFSSEILTRSEKLRKRKQWELPLDFLPILAEQCKRMQTAADDFVMHSSTSRPQNVRGRRCIAGRRLR